MIVRGTFDPSSFLTTTARCITRGGGPRIGDNIVQAEIDGTTCILLGTGHKRLIASEIANIWSEDYLAMFSEASDSRNAPPLDFDWFDCKAIANTQEQ